MNTVSVVAVLVLAAAGAVWWYAVFGRNRRAIALTRRFPALDSQVPRVRFPLIPDPLMVAESALPDANNYAAALQRLVDEQDRLAEEEDSHAKSTEVVAGAETAVTASARSVETLQDAKFARGIRVAFATKRLRRAKAIRDAAQTHAARLNARFSEALAGVRREENAVENARGEWERIRPIRAEDAILPPPMIEQSTLLVMFFDSVKPKAIARLLRRYRLTVVSGTARLSLFVVRPENSLL